MMSKAQIQAYRIELEHEMRDHHNARMKAMDEIRYSDMQEYNLLFERTVIRINTIDKILKD